MWPTYLKIVFVASPQRAAVEIGFWHTTHAHKAPVRLSCAQLSTETTLSTHTHRRTRKHTHHCIHMMTRLDTVAKLVTSAPHSEGSTPTRGEFLHKLQVIVAIRAIVCVKFMFVNTLIPQDISILNYRAVFLKQKI